MDNEPKQLALFQIEGPDEDGCVYLRDKEDMWRITLGHKDVVAEAMCQWLRSIDQSECR
jgi:hypothetical protein